MKLGAANRTLFGETPRYVGLVGPELGERGNQFIAFDRTLFKKFLDSNYGERNMYTRISHIDNGSAVLDEVFLDLDVEKPDDADSWEMDVIPKMREDRLVADDVLGDVIEDARRVGRYLQAQDWPAIGVFSGLGIHIHILTESKSQPDRALETMVKKIEDEADLQTVDERGARQGDYNRLCRIANCPRIAADGYPLNLYTVPLTVDELTDLTAEWLLDVSSEPRQIQQPRKERPPLEVQDEYEATTEANVVDVEAKEMAESVSLNQLDEQLESFVKDVLRMPCMYERLLTRNPDHDVRLNCAVLLFNCGFDVKEVKDLYSSLGWFDYDPEVTESHLEHIYEKGYSSMSCQTIQDKGLCVYERDERPDCKTFGWKGGQSSWHQ